MNGSALRQLLTGAAIFTPVAAVLTWPLAARIATHAPDHHDVYFNMWRLRWAAHAAVSPEADLLHGNIFHPERGTLLFSDAMPVVAAAAAPLLWIGWSPVLVHNLVLLAAMVLSAAGVFVVASEVTGNRRAAAVAGLIYGFAPYRFEHLAHLELQWAVWIPWTFWALHRLAASGRGRYGIAAGVFVALQFYSSVYYGIFLGLLLPVVAITWLLRSPQAVRRLTALVLGGLVAAAAIAPYAWLYASTRERVGTRDLQEVAAYSAEPDDYLAATPDNRMYGRWSAQAGSPERRLFPGVLAIGFAVAGLIAGRRSVPTGAWAVGVAGAMILSFGAHVPGYELLYRGVPGLDGLRAPARAAVLMLFFAAALAAQGYAWLDARVDARRRPLWAVAAIAVLMLEYSVLPLALAPYPAAPPPLYAWLAQQPRTLIVEFPLPDLHALPGDDPRFAYLSTFHWLPTVNGYSGYYPASYLRNLEGLRQFPEAESIARLRRLGVGLVIVHGPLAAEVPPGPLVPIARFHDGRAEATVFELR